jgi:hypothetical protein
MKEKLSRIQPHAPTRMDSARYHRTTEHYDVGPY